jgi:hypothetical protein
VKDKQKAAAFAAASVLFLAGACLGGLLWPGIGIPLIAAGFAGYVLCGRRAMVLLRVDDVVFAPRRVAKAPGAAASAVSAGLMVGTIASFALSQASRTRPISSRRGPSGRASSKPVRFPQPVGH